MNIQEFRRKLTHYFFGLGTKQKQTLYQTTDLEKIKTVLVIRPNHRLGNQLLVTPIFVELINRIPEVQITYLGKGDLSKTLFQHFKVVNRFILMPKKHFKELHNYIGVYIKVLFNKHDLVINLAEGSSSGNLLARLARAKYKVLNNKYTNQQLNINQVHMALRPIANFRKCFGLPENEPFPGLSLGFTKPHISSIKWYREKEERLKKPILFLFTNATGSKDYDATFWQEMATLISQNFPEHHLVEFLPICGSSKLNGAIDQFYSKDLMEMAKVLACGDIMITGDCGIMHLAVAAPIKTIALFKSNSIEIYKPYGNQNRVIDTRNYTPKEIVQQIKFLQ
ncbi:MAG: glycosyltransferase family 9 protein [Flavobacterium sp.]|jgi:ADP-heptose:LPS heptosyltransferase|uniref:glycosyltransferase family 9 protein n=1 Tax=Flavobacterium sp. TaxID=239 RepID=UPI003BA53AA3